MDGPPHRRRDDDPTPDSIQDDELAWWTNLPELVGKLQRLLGEATEELKKVRRQLVILKRGRNTNRKLIAASVLFNVLVMLLFGYLFDQRDQQREDDIVAVRTAFYEQCVDINSNARTINEFIGRQIEQVRTSPIRTAEEKARMIAGYKELRQAEPKCIPPNKSELPE